MLVNERTESAGSELLPGLAAAAVGWALSAAEGQRCW